MHTFAVAVLVGPDDTEVARLADLMASVEAWEPRPCHWVLVDDGAAERRLLESVRIPRGSDAVCLPYPRQRTDLGKVFALGAGTLSALAYVQARTRARFLLKMDTDALVIGPFADEIDRHLAASPDAGIVGTLGDTSNPAAHPRGKLQRLSKLVALLRLMPAPPAGGEREEAAVPVEGLGLVTIAELRAFAAVRPHIEHAVARGYEALQYCQGGAYVVTRELMDRMARADYFQALAAWNDVPIGEDVMMGMYAYAAALQLVNRSGEGEPFGVQFRGLPYPPATLVARGHTLVHSLKNDVTFSEDALRQYFARLRAGRARRLS
jgi:hypothetical protein